MHIPAKYMAKVFLRPNRSARRGTARQPSMVPTERITVPNEAVLAACAMLMPAFFAKLRIAVGSYTDPAQRPIMATVSKVAFTIVLLRYCGPKIPFPARLRETSIVCFHLLGSFSRRVISKETTTGERPHRNMARQPNRAPTV